MHAKTIFDRYYLITINNITETLLEIANKANISVIEFLVEHGADSNYYDGYEYTALHKSLLGESIEVFSYLLEKWNNLLEVFSYQII